MQADLLGNGSPFHSETMPQSRFLALYLGQMLRLTLFALSER